MHYYSTEWKMQQVMELSAVDKEIRRLLAKRVAHVVGGGDPSTSTPNPNLSAPQSATLNPFVQHLASTLPLPVLQPWTMQGFATALQTPLFKAQGGQLMTGAGTHTGQQVPTSVPQPPAQPLPGDGSLGPGRFSGSAGPSQNHPDPDPDPDPEKKKRDKAIDVKRKGRFLIDSVSEGRQRSVTRQHD